MQMMKIIQKKPLFLFGFFAIPMMIFIALMGSFYPIAAVNGFNNFIIAFEFIATKEELLGLFNALDQTDVVGIDIGNKIDFGFMLVYGGFFFLIFKKLKSLHQYEYARLGQLLALLMVIGDLVENIQLLELTNYTGRSESFDVEGSLAVLQVATWSKWFSIAIAVALVGGAYWEYYGFYAKILSLIMSIPILLGAHAIIQTSPFSIEIFTASIFIMIGLIVVHCFFLKPVILKTKIS